MKLKKGVVGVCVLVAGVFLAAQLIRFNSQSEDQMKTSLSSAEIESIDFARPTGSPSPTPTATPVPTPPPSCSMSMTTYDYVQALVNLTREGIRTSGTLQAEIDILEANGQSAATQRAQLAAYMASYLDVTRYLQSQISLSPLNEVPAAKTLEELLTSGCNNGNCATVTIKCGPVQPGAGATCNPQTCVVNLDPGTCQRQGYHDGQQVNPSNPPWSPYAGNGSQAIQECMAKHEFGHAQDNPATCPSCSSEYYAFTDEASCLANYISDKCGTPRVWPAADCAAIRNRRQLTQDGKAFNDCVCRRRSATDQNKFLPGTCDACKSSSSAANRGTLVDLYCKNREEPPTPPTPTPSPSASPTPHPI